MFRNIVVVAVLLIGTAFSLQARADYWFRVLHSAHRLTHFRVITADDGGFLAILALAS